jgi:hypothetical protein
LLGENTNIRTTIKIIFFIGFILKFNLFVYLVEELVVVPKSSEAFHLSYNKFTICIFVFIIMALEADSTSPSRGFLG